MGSIRFDLLQGDIAILTMNRPHVLNALNWQAIDSFAQAIEVAHGVEGLRALLITGAGSAFCSGGDLLDLEGYSSRTDGLRLTALMTEALRRLDELPYPTIAAIEGPALGGGAEIALACDMRVLSEGAKLGMMHVRLGITPAWGGGQRLLRQVGYAQALEWLASGSVLNAVEAYEFGLANRVVKDGKAIEVAREMAYAFTRHDPQTIRAIKRLLKAGIMLPPEEAAALEQAEFPDLWAAPAHLEAASRLTARLRGRKGQRVG